LLTLLLSLRDCFRARAFLQAEILALRHQLLVLQRSNRGHKLRLGWADRVLWVWLSRLWNDWRSALLLVKPETVIAWHRQGFRLYWRWKSRCGEGRPTVSPEVRNLIRHMSLANPRWGAPRIHGELLKLGIQVSQATVAKYMVRHRKPPSQSWRTFLKNHAKDLVSTDFFIVPTIAFQLLFVFVILDQDRRRPIHFAVTANRTAEWTARQLLEAFPWDNAPRYLLRDRVYGEKFCETAKSMGIREVLAAPRSPWQNPFAERLVGSIRRECLDHVIVFHEAGLRRILKDYFEYYERCRTHLSLEKGAPVSRPVELPSLGHPASPGIKPCFPCCSVRSPGGVSSITSRSRRSCWSWPFPPTPPSRIFRGYAVPLHKTTISRIPLPHEAAGLSTPTESIISASRAGRRSLDFVPRRNGSADPPVRRRSVPRFHSFAGGNGGPLAARRGQGSDTQHHRERPRSNRDRRDRDRRFGSQVCPGRMGHGASDPRSSGGDGCGAPPLSSSLPRNTQCGSPGAERSHAPARDRADKELESRRQEGAAFCTEDFAACAGDTRGLWRGNNCVSPGMVPFRRRTYAPDRSGDTPARGLALSLPLHSVSDCRLRAGGGADVSEPASRRADPRTGRTALVSPHIAQQTSRRA